MFVRSNRSLSDNWIVQPLFIDPRMDSPAPCLCSLGCLGLELRNSSRVEHRDEIITVQKERDTAFLDAQEKRRDLECMQKKAHDAVFHAWNLRNELECMEQKTRDAALLDAWNSRNELKCMQKQAIENGIRRHRESLERIAHVAELAQPRLNFENVENELVTMREEKNRRETAHKAVQKSLEQMTKEKETLELAHRADMAQAHRDRQTFHSEMQDFAIGKGKAEEELVTMREEQDRLKTVLETIQNNLVEEQEKKLCLICLESPKDAICMPCLHSGYCFRCLEEHRKRSRTCPTCRTILSGVLLSDIGI
ncbi:unnamed protein product [Calypogeia fissa]